MLDDTDRALIAALQHNARESVSTLARKLGVARTTVLARMQKLESGGVIPGAIVASALYVVTVQLARAQQAHSRRSLRRRMAALHRPPETPPQD